MEAGPTNEFLLRVSEVLIASATGLCPVGSCSIAFLPSRGGYGMRMKASGDLALKEWQALEALQCSQLVKLSPAIYRPKAVEGEASYCWPCREAARLGEAESSPDAPQG